MTVPPSAKVRVKPTLPDATVIDKVLRSEAFSDLMNDPLMQRYVAATTPMRFLSSDDEKSKTLPTAWPHAGINAILCPGGDYPCAADPVPMFGVHASVSAEAAAEIQAGIDCWKGHMKKAAEIQGQGKVELVAALALTPSGPTIAFGPKGERWTPDTPDVTGHAHGAAHTARTTLTAAAVPASPGLFTRVWAAIKDFFRNIFGRRSLA